MLSLFNKLSCELFISNSVENITCARHFAQTCYLNRCRRTCLSNSSSLVVCHRSDSADRCTCYEYIARFECTVLNEQRSNRAFTLVKSCLDYSTLSQLVGVSFKLLDFCDQQYVFKQVVNAHTRLSRNGHSDNVTAPFLNNKVMLGELLLYPVRVCGVLIHLVYRNYYRNACCFSMVYRLYRLWHDTVVSCNNKYSYIRDICTSCSHRGESLMSRSIQEGYLLALVAYLISTDMLCDTACLTVCNVSISYLIQN